MAVVTADPALRTAIDDWADRDEAASLRLFVPAARELAASTRLALAHAMRESLKASGDARVSDAKSAWWMEEVACAARGEARHPLTRGLGLLSPAFAWPELASAFGQLRRAEPYTDDALEAYSAVERALWFGPTPCDSAACETRALAVMLRARRPDSDARTEFGAQLSTARWHELRARLEAAKAVDAWSAALRAQVLHAHAHLEGSARIRAQRSRWREIWLVWSAVRRAQRLSRE